MTSKMACGSAEPFNYFFMIHPFSRFVFGLAFNQELRFSHEFYYMRLLIKQKMVVPSDNQKKNLANCRIALQYLKDAGVSLKDDEGIMIPAEDVADGDRELTISLLWNIFVHLQVSVSCFSLSNFWWILLHVSHPFHWLCMLFELVSCLF